MHAPSPKPLPESLFDSPITVLIADDEAPARRRLADLLRCAVGSCEIIEAVDGDAAVQLIERHRPDLAFLDVQMPGRSGLDVVRTIGSERMPVTVFVTAYDQHAISAFEAEALDYLLKPFSDERFDTTLLRVAKRLAQRSAPAPTAQPAEAERWERLVVRSAGTTQFIKAADIDWIEAVGVYVNLYSGGKATLYRSPIHVLAEKLDPARFVRIHRSAIVNLDSVLQLEAISHGEFDVILKHGGRAKVSRTYRSQLEKRLGQAL